MNWFISKIIGLFLIVAGVVLEVMWISFLFGSVLGIVLLLIFAPGWFFAPLGITTMGIGFLFMDKNKGEISESLSGQQEGSYTKGRSAEIFIKILKVMVILCSLFLVGVGTTFAYQYYEKNKKEKEELSFDTSLKWDWLDRDNSLREGIQIHTIEEVGRSFLRKVDIQKKSAIYAYKNLDYSITTMATFSVKCEPEKEIVTSKTFANGDPKKLVCNKDGNQLSFSVTHSEKDNQFTWVEDLDGFSVNESFYSWDFSKLDREVTLSKQSSNEKSGEKEGSIQPNVPTSMPENVYSDWLRQALEIKDLAKRLEHALLWTQAQPENAGAWTLLGIAYLGTNQSDKAIGAFEQSTRIAPKHDIVWYYLGTTYQNTKLYSKAIEAYQQATRINPKYADAWYELGVAYKKTGQTSKIIQVHDRLKTLDSNMAEKFFSEVVSSPVTTNPASTTNTIIPKIDGPKLQSQDTPLSDADFSKTFRCPETLTNQAREESNKDFVAWALQKGNITSSELVEIRMRLLEEHHCDETLAKIKSSSSLPNPSGKWGEAKQQEIPKAVDTVLASVSGYGMAGLTSEIIDCYKKQMNESYCFYLDIATREYDQMVAEGMHFPPNEFCSEKEFRRRIEPIFTKLKMDSNTTNRYIADTSLAIKGLLIQGMRDSK